MIKIEEATIEDASILTEITKKSKAYWGYTEEQLLEWTDQLTVTKEDILTYYAYKLILENQTIGYYSYGPKSDEIMVLHNLFVLPEYIGKGFGKILMLDFLQRVDCVQFKSILLYADPNAENFYRKFGFIQIDKLATSIENRFLPIMELKLTIQTKS